MAQGQHFGGFYLFYRFLSLFFPEKFTNDTVRIENVDVKGKFIGFESYDDNILLDFCMYLTDYEDLFTGVDSDYNYWDLFEMAGLFL